MRSWRSLACTARRSSPCCGAPAERRALDREAVREVLEPDARSRGIRVGVNDPSEARPVGPAPLARDLEGDALASSGGETVRVAGEADQAGASRPPPTRPVTGRRSRRRRARSRRRAVAENAG